MKTSINPFLFFFLFCTFNLFGQDLIITNSKEELKTKVIEIDELLVKYKKFDFQDGPIYSVKKSDIFLIIYSNGTRETFNQNEIDRVSPGTQSVKNSPDSDKEELNNTTTSISSKNSLQNNPANPEKLPIDSSKSILFKKGDRLLGLGLGTGVLLGNSGGLANVNIPYLSARFDNIYIQFGENMSIGAGLFAAYHSYSIGILGNESIFNVISGGLSGSYYYSFSEKLAVGAGVRVLYVSVSSFENFGYDIGPVGNVNLYVLGSVYYKVSKKLILFSELSSGISNVNLGIQLHL